MTGLAVYVSRPAGVWRIANNQSGSSRGRYIWFVTRERADGSGISDYYDTPTGRLRRFATHEAAQRAADKLNRETGVVEV